MKKTIIIILSALMAFSVSAIAADFTETSALADKKPAKRAKGEIKEITFSVHLHCNNCVKKVQENIAFEKRVKDLKVSLENQTVAIKYDAAKTSEQTLKAAIEALGYKVTSADCDVHEHHEHRQNDK